MDELRVLAASPKLVRRSPESKPRFEVLNLGSPKDIWLIGTVREWHWCIEKWTAYSKNLGRCKATRSALIR